ncbi:MAG: helix-turn-helix domain-containing protein [Bacteroidales bacterium]|nr:helix-turn-helix domain-containing protein [Bacteroidales bacterium]
MNQPEFGNELVKIRKAKGLTQSELAEKCGVSYRTIQRIEAGIVAPRGYTIRAISVALDFDFLKEFPNNSSGKNKSDRSAFTFTKQIIEQTIDLFNLKTNTMKKLTILTVIFGLIGIGLFTVSNKSIAQEPSKHPDFSVADSIASISKKDALKKIKQINRKATFHNQSIDVIETYAKKSNYNFDTYVILSELISNFGHSTQPAMEIANIVFLTYKECDLFNDIAPLIFLNNHGSNEVYVKLAKDASAAKTEEEINRIKEQVDKYKKQAEFQTLEEAYNNQKKI